MSEPVGPAEGAHSAGRFARRVGQTYGASLGNALLAFGNSVVISRALGVEGRGEVVFVVIVAELLAILAMMGVQEAMVNEAGARPELRPSLASNAVLLSVLFGSAILGLFAVFDHIFPGIIGGENKLLVWFTIATVPVLVLGVYMQYLLYADYAFTAANAMTIFPIGLSITVNALLALLGTITVSTVILTWALGQIIATATLVTYVQVRLAGFGRLDLRLARATVSFGLKSYLGRIMQLGNYRLDQWLLGSIGTTTELGLYSVAVAWAETLFYLPGTLALVQRPDLVRGSDEHAGRSAAALFRISLLITLVPMIGLIVLAPFLCGTIFGEEFSGAATSLRILALGAFGMVSIKQLGNAMTARGRPLRTTAGVGAAFVATVVLDVALIPSFGAGGASIASTVAYSIGGLVIAVLFTMGLGVSPSVLVPRRGDASFLIGAVQRRFGREINQSVSPDAEVATAPGSGTTKQKGPQ